MTAVVVERHRRTQGMLTALAASAWLLVAPASAAWAQEEAATEPMSTKGEQGSELPGASTDGPGSAIPTATSPYDGLPSEIAVLARRGDSGDVDAQFDLALRYRDGNGVDRNYEKATSLLRRAAEKGHVQAQYLLASHYRVGLGVEQNVAEAVRWYRMAAERGNLSAAHRLGRLYEAGAGVSGAGALPADRERALHWYRFGYDRQCTPCAHSAGLMLLNPPQGDPDPAAALDWLSRAANAAYAPAQLSLAELLAQGAGGVPADPVEAYKWATLAAVQGEEAAVELRELLSARTSPEQRVEARNRLADWRPTDD